MKMIAFFKSFAVCGLVCLTLFLFIFGFKTCDFEYEKVFAGFDDYEKVTIVSKENLSNQNMIESGELKYYTFSKFQHGQALDALNKDGFEGVVFSFSKEKNLDDFRQKLGCDLTIPKKVANAEVCYGYTSLFDRFVMAKGKKLNVQIAKTEYGWIVGLPMIITGF